MDKTLQHVYGPVNEKTLFDCGPDCDLGFCLGTRLGEGRGPPMADKFCAPYLRRI